MAATITLTAVPGHIEQHAGYRAKTVEFCSRELARTTMQARTVGEVRKAVRASPTPRSRSSSACAAATASPQASTPPSAATASARTTSCSSWTGARR